MPGPKYLPMNQLFQSALHSTDLWEKKTPLLYGIYIVRLSLLTMTNLNHIREMLMFVCSVMAD